MRPSDPDAPIAKMKDGRTYLAHKAEHAVDLASGAVVAVTTARGDGGPLRAGCDSRMRLEMAFDITIALWVGQEWQVNFHPDGTTP